MAKSGDRVMLSLDMDCVFLEGDKMRNKVDGLVD